MKTNKTKLILLTLSFFGATLINKVKAQGNLQFNQVISTLLTPSASYTVPTGKVFKLEASAGGATGAAQLQSNCGFSSVSNVHYSGITVSGGSNTALWGFPIWFKAGDVLFVPSNSVYISGIEFNITP